MRNSIKKYENVTADNNVSFTLDIYETDYTTLTNIADAVSQNVVTEYDYYPENKTPLMLFYILDNMTNYKPDCGTDGVINYDEMYKLSLLHLGHMILIKAMNEVDILIYLNNIVDEKIEFRKQKLLNKKSDLLEDYLTSLIQKEIENQDLQKKILDQQYEVNEKYKDVDLIEIKEIIDTMNKNFNNPEFIKAMAETVHNDKSIKQIKTPQDHKKPSTNLKVVKDGEE